MSLTNLLTELNQNLNQLQQQASMSNVASAGLNQQIKDYQKAIALTRQAMAGQLREAELQSAVASLNLVVDDVRLEIGNYITGTVTGTVIGGDNVSGDQIGRDKIAGDSILGNKIVNFFRGGSQEARSQRNRQMMLRLVHDGPGGAVPVSLTGSGEVVGGGTVPPVPVLSSPSDGSYTGTVSVMLAWQRVSGAADYEVEWTGTGDFLDADSASVELVAIDEDSIAVPVGDSTRSFDDGRPDRPSGDHRANLGLWVTSRIDARAVRWIAVGSTTSTISV